MKDFDQFGLPYTNRAVPSTETYTMNLCCDWVTANSQNNSDFESFLSLLGLDLDLFECVSTNLYKCKTMYFYNGIRVFTDSINWNNCKFVLEFTGSGCRFLESLGRLDWDHIFYFFKEYDLKVTRFDLALDVYNYNGFTLDDMFIKLKNKHVLSKFRRFRRVQSYEIENFENLGYTLYFGSPSSDIMFRFYDKLRERLVKGVALESWINNWMRFEIQTRRDNSVALFGLFFLNGSDLPKMFKGLLFNYLNFLTPNYKDSNKKRWNTCGWWKKFLGDVEKVKLNKVYKEPTILRKKFWLQDSVSKTNALINLTGYLTGMVNPLDLNLGFEKLKDSKQDLAILNKFLLDCGREQISMNYFNFLLDKKIADYNRNNQL